MRLSWRDVLATVLVLAAAALYLLWLDGTEVLGMSSARSIGIAVMVLGFVASVTAVVYGVGAGLLDAPKLYLALTSLLGLGALVAGVWVLTVENEAMLGALVAATAILWLMSTIRHVRIAEPRAKGQPGPPALGHDMEAHGARKEVR